ncbi:MAG: hypothetical protein ACI89X_003417 [Planctomycetota bacterium]
MVDANEDGYLDVVMSSLSSRLLIMIGNGDGTFSSPLLSVAIGGHPWASASGDINGDGDLDIIGANEITDVGMIFTQTGPVTTGLQPASCDATIRIDQLTTGDGFGGRPAVPVRRGNSAALSLSGSPGGFDAIALGFAGTTALPLQWGLMSFDPLLPIIVMTLLLWISTARWGLPFRFLLRIRLALAYWHRDSCLRRAWNSFPIQCSLWCCPKLTNRTTHRC